MEAKELIRSIQDVKGIEKIVWAYTGVKKCSELKVEDKDRLLPVIDALDIVYYENTFVQVQGWPTWEEFRNQYPDKYHGDLAAGMFYDLPYCCAKAYHDDVVKTDRRFYLEHPFRGKSTVEDIQELTPEGGENIKMFYKELNDHSKTHGRKNFQESRGLEGVGLLDTGELPASTLYFLKEFEPCSLGCDNFLAMSERMSATLHEYLDEAKIAEIQRDSREFIEWWSKRLRED